MTTFVEAPVRPEVHELRVADRCDRCGAQAFMIAALVSGRKLFFCAHHGREHTPVLLAEGHEVHDFSDRLNEKPTAPSIDDI